MVSHRRLRPGRMPGLPIGGKPGFQTGRAGILPAFNFSGARRIFSAFHEVSTNFQILHTRIGPLPTRLHFPMIFLNSFRMGS